MGTAVGSCPGSSRVLGLNTEMASFKIRPYRGSDRAVLRRCVIEIQEFERKLDNRLSRGEEIADGYLADMLVHAGKPTAGIFVAELKGAIVGYVAVNAKVTNDEPDEYDYEYAYISDVFVLESIRGQGVGKALLFEAEKFASEHGAHWLRISVLGVNKSAHRLYQSLGFEPREIVLEKSLSQREQ